MSFQKENWQHEFHRSCLLVLSSKILYQEEVDDIRLHELHAFIFLIGRRSVEVKAVIYLTSDVILTIVCWWLFLYLCELIQFSNFGGKIHSDRIWQLSSSRNFRNFVSFGCITGFARNFHLTISRHFRCLYLPEILNFMNHSRTFH